ncbi:kelch-like protein 40b isoform X2 [Xyrauchen texanus]|uniref:kelch-like protein 40b isoform X2 n=1 Tax=Xyrauchen texanus TaxID=154827 RepID=UPI00224274E8|nr:kelch-like protein 40b isoform X2 [Xyrauchen texanus]
MALPIDPMEEPRIYQQTLLQDGLYDLLESDMMVDCVLKIKDKEFPCHRLVLAACSSYFRAFFKSGVEESKQREIVLEDVEPGVMGMIIKYIYTSNINVTEQNVQDIFALANMLQIPSIFTVCVSFLQKRLSLSNSLAIFRLGLMLDCPRLAISARNFACERFQFIARDEEFLQLNPSELAAIIASDSLNVETEQEVFEALIKWVGYDQEKRLEDLPVLLDCVRLRLVPHEYFAKNVEKHEWLSSNPEISKKLQLVKDAHAGKLPEVKAKSIKSEDKKDGDGGEEGEEEEQEELLPGILNDNLRFGMFLRDLIFLISYSATAAYDPTGNDCYVASLSTQIPKNHCSLVTKENQIFVAGGIFYDEQSKDEQIYSYFLQFDPESSDWMGMPPMPSPRFLFGMGEAENSIYVIGGREMKEGEQILDTVMVYDRKECLKRVSAYDTKKQQWTDLAPLNTARSLFGVTIHKNKIYVAAGVTDTGITGSSEVYDIKTNTWSEFVEFPQPRSSLSLVTVAGVLYAVGGFAMLPKEDSDELLPKEMNDIWRYDEVESNWNGILREIRYASGATVLGVRLNSLRLTKM